MASAGLMANFRLLMGSQSVSVLGLRLEKRPSPSPALRALAPVATAVLALAASGGLIRAAGGDPFEAMAAIGVGAFGNLQNCGETMVKAAALILVGLGIIVAFRTQVPISAAARSSWGPSPTRLPSP
jgi:hypothetical protein